MCYNYSHAIIMSILCYNDHLVECTPDVNISI